MVDSNDIGLIGVDAGGTSCRIALRWHGQRTELVLGRANVASDFSGAVGLIGEGLEAVAAKAGLPKGQLRACPAHLGLAGVVDEADAAAVAEALPLEFAEVGDDRRATLVGALGDADGTVAGVGTGSFLARRSGMDMQLVGGWGLRLGDEASGAWLGRRLLTSVLEVVDGLREPTSLTEETFESFRRSPGGIVRFSLESAPADFAALAPRIVDAAGAGDPVGTLLMSEGSGYLTTTMLKLGWQEGERLCLVGGVAPHYRAYLPECFARSVVPAEGTALDGALRLAGDLASRGKRRPGP